MPLEASPPDPGQANAWRQEVEQWLPGQRGVGSGLLVFHEDRDSLREEEKVLRWMVVMVAQGVDVHNVTELYA